MKEKIVRCSALDIFRGIAIIIMIIVDAPPDFEAVPPILLHSPWQGITIADLAFPGFVFSMGASAAFSLRRGAHRRKIMRRIILLFLMGILFNAIPGLFAFLFTPEYDGAAFFEQSVAHGRIPSVLGRLALTYGLGMSLLILLKSSFRLTVAAFFLLAVSSLGFHLYAPAAPFEAGHNVSQAVDLAILGAAHIYRHYGFPFDPEGLYGTLASTASMIFGCLAGRRLSGSASARSEDFALAGNGLCLLALGWAWSSFDIISKPLWTAPYVLITSGGSLMLLSCLDALLHRHPHLVAWLRPCLAFGANPLFWYIATNITLVLLWTLPSPETVPPLYPWLWHQWSQDIHNPPLTATVHMIIWCMLWWPLAEMLYQRGIIVKL